MRFISRALFTFVLLGGLAFGSYAFGKYVLSSRLFGNKGSKLNQNFGESALAPAPRASGGKIGQNATASVEILPENSGSGRASEPAPRSASRTVPPDALVDRSNQSGDDGSTVGDAGDIIGAPGYDSGRDIERDSTTRRTRRNDSNAGDSSPERPRKRRKRRRPRPTTAPQVQTRQNDEPVRQDAASEPDVVISGDNNQDSPPPRVETRVEPRIEPRRETPREAAPSDTTPTEPRRRRRRIRVENPDSAPRERAQPRERVRIEPRRERPREESPVPRPEGGNDGGGGDSPVPIPE